MLVKGIKLFEGARPLLSATRKPPGGGVDCRPVPWLLVPGPVAGVFHAGRGCLQLGALVKWIGRRARSSVAAPRRARLRRPCWKGRATMLIKPCVRACSSMRTSMLDHAYEHVGPCVRACWTMRASMLDHAYEHAGPCVRACWTMRGSMLSYASVQ
jgi:hypothetical protein